MKFIIICYIIFLGIQLSHQDQFAAKLIKDYFSTHQETRKACLAEINVDEAIESNYEKKGDIVKDENLGCFIKCLVIKEKIMSEAGEISIETIRKLMKLPDNGMLDGLKDKCSQFDKVDLCQGIIQFANCIVEYLKPYLPQ